MIGLGPVLMTSTVVFHAIRANRTGQGRGYNIQVYRWRWQSLRRDRQKPLWSTGGGMSMRRSRKKVPGIIYEIT
ncbi:hypothetical protein BDV28DRAFT_27657 [Aspergillus coremiiformis]|uniref:Uncharacterized protein n=1 Tax=Aspergillus coremiiformis TaxID=138285 RepID=A0A5N6ZHZ3_9EURO|nr:hypothetical protein BDV28DRAFT_27657 [Aspergillus coremiiformis]